VLDCLCKLRAPLSVSGFTSDRQLCLDNRKAHRMINVHDTTWPSLRIASAAEVIQHVFDNSAWSVMTCGPQCPGSGSLRETHHIQIFQQHTHVISNHEPIHIGCRQGPRNNFSIHRTFQTYNSAKRICIVVICCKL
jgi:hypothetical protein